jgi:hypothetical protein
VIIGKDGWLYYTGEKIMDIMDDYHGKIKMKDDEMEIARVYFNLLDKFIESKGAKFFIAVCPNPQTIYPEYLPDYEKYNMGNPSLLDQYIDYFRRHNGPDIIDLRPVLLDARNSPDRVLYYSNDSHWNYLGAGIAFGELISRINESGIAVQIPPYSLQRGAEYEGDLARMIAAETVPKSASYNFVFSPEVSVQVNSNWEDQVYNQVSNAKNGIKTVLLGDSYSIQWRHLLGASFAVSHIEQGTANSRKPDIGRKMEEYAPDIVIYEFVERGLHGWRTFIWDGGLDDYSADIISGCYGDGWVSPAGNFRVRTGDLGSITFVGYYPGEITPYLTGTLYINDEPKPFSIGEQIFAITAKTPKNEDISVRIENNFLFVPGNLSEIRELCFILTDLYVE